jgi:hypothetical protein
MDWADLKTAPATRACILIDNHHTVFLSLLNSPGRASFDEGRILAVRAGNHKRLASYVRVRAQPHIPDFSQCRSCFDSPPALAGRLASMALNALSLYK